MNKTLEKIRKFYADNKRMPSYAEIAALAGFKSKNAAYTIYKFSQSQVEGKDVEKKEKEVKEE